MTDIIVVALIVIAVVLAVGYIIKQKKKGVKCIGCSSAGTCAYKNSSSCCGNCGCNAEESCDVDYKSMLQK